MNRVPSGDPACLAEKLQDIPCPWWRAVIQENLVNVGPDGIVSMRDVRHALKESGVSWGLREFTLLGIKPAAAQIAGAWLRALSMDTINVLQLPKCFFMHTADSGILRHGFDQEKLDRLLSYSSDGLNLTVSDLATANKDQVKAEPGHYGHALGVVEYALLLGVFGRENEAGERYISKEDLITLYKDNRFPAGWVKQSLGFARLNRTLASLWRHQKGG